uniref:Putative ribonuclease H-like domain-containing protein n=1 Tax=Tanacetum cinerariifolium TaxID=118510 RepID=A0A699IW91_TANCI|nr:putative ribonuclease H-like domain-containing protein [Tanacetum cinerariifolium]
MADNRTMEELLQAPTEGYGEAIVIPKINADHFEIKTNLLQLVQAKPYHGFERETPHTHINNFKRITSTLKFKDLPNDVLELMLSKRSRKNTKCVNAANEELTAAKHKLLIFEDPENPDKVYKVVKALYGLHQAPRAWYETLATYLLENRFQRGKIDQTLFIKKQQKDILLVKIYVDDIIFGATNKALCQSFEKLMKDKCQMSSMGELTFFLGLQVKQKKDGIFISQDKYVAEISKKFGLSEGKSASTPIDAEKPLLKDSDGEDIDVHTYRSMIAYSDSDYAGASLDRKSTTGGCQFLRCRLIFWQCNKQTVVATSSTEAEYVAAASGCAQVLWIQNQLLDYGHNFMHTFLLLVYFTAFSFNCCYLRNLVIEIAVLNILSDALPITTNGIQLTMSNP